MAYVIIELKTRKLLPAAVGQLNMYLNYYKAEINDADDNDPIGIILCTDKPSAKVNHPILAKARRWSFRFQHRTLPCLI